MSDPDSGNRVSIEIDLPDQEWFRLMCLAHEQDITLNQLVDQILRQMIEEMSAEQKAEK